MCEISASNMNNCVSSEGLNFTMETKVEEDPILMEIRCSVCHIAPYPYVQFCREGHVMCQRCSVTRTSCPRKSEMEEACNQPILPIIIQSALHHKILRMNKPIFKTNTEISVTKEDCPFEAPVALPEVHVGETESEVLVFGKCPFESCDYVSLMEDNLVNHIASIHKVRTVEESDAEIETTWGPIGRKVGVILNCHDQQFMLLMRDNGKDLLHLWVSRINNVADTINQGLRIHLRLQKPRIENSIEEGRYSIQAIMDPSSTLYEPDENCCVIKKDLLLKKLSSLRPRSDGDADLRELEPSTSVFISIVDPGKSIPDPCTPSSCNAEKMLPSYNHFPPVEPSPFSSPIWESFEDASSTEFQRDIERHGYVNKNYPRFVLKPPDLPVNRPDPENQPDQQPKTSKEDESWFIPSELREQTTSKEDESWPIPSELLEQTTDPSPLTQVMAPPELEDTTHKCSFFDTPESEKLDSSSSNGTRTVTPLEIELKTEHIFEERSRQNFTQCKISLKNINNCILRKPMAPPTENTDLIKELESIRLPTKLDAIEKGSKDEGYHSTAGKVPGGSENSEEFEVDKTNDFMDKIDQDMLAELGLLVSLETSKDLHYSQRNAQHSKRCNPFKNPDTKASVVHYKSGLIQG